MPPIDLVTLFTGQPQDIFVGTVIGLPFLGQLAIGS